MNEMSLLRNALEAISTALDSRRPLPEMISQIEQFLCSALHPARVEIRLAEVTAPVLGIAIPLRLDGNVIGTVLAVSAPHPLPAEVADVLKLLAAPIAAAIAYRSPRERRGREGQSARIDALCRIPNRLAFDERLREAWARCKQSGGSLAIALVDVDFFKAYNEEYGHVGGDRCLRRVAAVLANRRDGDGGFCARYGGEEFVMLFEDTNLDRAIADMQRILDRLDAGDMRHGRTTLGRVSVSVGVAATVPTHDRTALKLIGEADRALFRAKRLGRNRICAGSFVSKGEIVSRRSARVAEYQQVDGPTFGRGDDLARILSALRHARMLTLVGPQGIGKSRLLALLAEAATRRLNRTVVFVEPELLHNEADPAHALAAAFDLAVDAGDALAAVTDYLNERDALLIFDNDEMPGTDIRAICEHIIERTSGVSIVVGAHSQLGIAAERSIVVPPLDDEATSELLAFHGGGDAAQCRSILRHLGGNPAAIHLAAECIVRLGYAAVLKGLEAEDGRRTGLEKLDGLLRIAPSTDRDYFDPAFAG